MPASEWAKNHKVLPMQKISFATRPPLDTHICRTLREKERSRAHDITRALYRAAEHKGKPFGTAFAELKHSIRSAGIDQPADFRSTFDMAFSCLRRMCLTECLAV